MTVPETRPPIDLSDAPATRPVLSHQQHWAGRIVSIESEIIPVAGVDVTREYVSHPGAVAIVALDENDRVAMIRQYRHPVRAELWEIPAGLLDVSGEDYLEAAKRELAEETDLQATTWHVLADFFTSPGGSDEALRIYLARGLSATQTPFERTEEEADMELAWVHLDDAVSKVLSGDFHSPSACMGLLATAAARSTGWSELRPADAPWLRAGH